MSSTVRYHAPCPCAWGACTLHRGVSQGTLRADADPPLVILYFSCAHDGVAGANLSIALQGFAPLQLAFFKECLVDRA